MRQRLHTLMKTCILPVTVAFAVGAFRLALRLPLPARRAHVLAAFGVGTFLALLGGVLLGGLLWRWVRKGRAWWAVLLVMAALSGVAAFGALTAWAGHTPVSHPLAEPIVLAFAVLLVSADSHALGHAFVSGRNPVPGKRRLAAILLLYGSLVAGFVAPWTGFDPAYTDGINRRRRFENMQGRAWHYSV